MGMLTAVGGGGQSVTFPSIQTGSAVSFRPSFADQPLFFASAAVDTTAPIFAGPSADLRPPFVNRHG
jgi:hypothetical protein